MALALALAGCGGSDKGKLSGDAGERLTGYVDAAQAAYEDGKCPEARAAAGKGARGVAKNSNIDDELRQNLIDGFNHLESELAANCDKPEESPTPSATATEAPTEAPTETPSPSPEPTETPSPEPTVTTEPTPSPTPVDGTGGASPEEADR